MAILVPILPGTLPSGVCYGSEQERLLAFAANMEAQVPSDGFLYISDSAPPADYQSFAWLNTTDMRIYKYEGVWISPNPEQSAYVRRLFYGTTVQLQTYDGGDTDAPSDRSGPMWEVDTDFEGRIPMGPGTIPTSDPSKTLAVAEAFGEGGFSLTEAQLPQITPILKAFVGNDSTGEQYITIPNNSDSFNSSYELNPFGGDPQDPINNVPPVRGCYVVKRTSRVYYTA